MTDEQPAGVGFIGTGTMGEPMAHNLIRAGLPLVVWNRTEAKTRALAAAGARVAGDVPDLFTTTRTVILMLVDGAAVDRVLTRGTPQFAEMVRGRLIMQMGTVLPEHSRDLAHDIHDAGGRYVEAPVSGQRGPAEAAQLVAMVAGERRDIDEVTPLLDAMCREVVECGPIPGAQSLKLASNLFVATTIVSLAETFSFARRQGLDLDLLASLLSSGPMASDLVRMKVPKLVAEDFEVQASVANVVETARLITEQAALVGAAVPLTEAAAALYGEAESLGLDQADVTAVIRALEQRSSPSSPGAA